MVQLTGAGHQRLECLKDKVQSSSCLENLDRFPLIVEAIGDKGLLEKVLMESKEGATILLLGFPYGKINYNFENIVAQGKTIVGSVGSTRKDFQWALSYLTQIDSEQFINKVLPLQDFDKAWDLHRSGKHLKILLKVGAKQS